MNKAEFEAELAEKREDVRIFRGAYESLRARLIQLEERSASRFSPPACNWSGATGIVDLLDVISNQMESMAKEMEAGREDIVTDVAPHLMLISEDNRDES